MAKDRMDVLELLRKMGTDVDIDFLREGLRMSVQAVMEAEVTSKNGAGLGGRSPERLTNRNGYRDRSWETRVGTIGLRIPKVWEGSYFPSLLEPRRRSERLAASKTSCKRSAARRASRGLYPQSMTLEAEPEEELGQRPSCAGRS